MTTMSHIGDRVQIKEGLHFEHFVEGDQGRIVDIDGDAAIVLFDEKGKNRVSSRHLQLTGSSRMRSHSPVDMRRDFQLWNQTVDAAEYLSDSGKAPKKAKGSVLRREVLRASKRPLQSKNRVSSPTSDDGVDHIASNTKTDLEEKKKKKRPSIPSYDTGTTFVSRAQKRAEEGERTFVSEAEIGRVDTWTEFHSKPTLHRSASSKSFLSKSEQTAMHQAFERTPTFTTVPSIATERTNDKPDRSIGLRFSARGDRSSRTKTVTALGNVPEERPSQRSSLGSHEVRAMTDKSYTPAEWEADIQTPREGASKLSVGMGRGEVAVPRRNSSSVEDDEEESFRRSNRFDFDFEAERAQVEELEAHIEDVGRLLERVSKHSKKDSTATITRSEDAPVKSVSNDRLSELPRASEEFSAKSASNDELRELPRASEEFSAKSASNDELCELPRASEEFSAKSVSNDRLCELPRASEEISAKSVSSEEFSATKSVFGDRLCELPRASEESEQAPRKLEEASSQYEKAPEHADELHELQSRPSGGSEIITDAPEGDKWPVQKASRLPSRTQTPIPQEVEPGCEEEAPRKEVEPAATLAWPPPYSHECYPEGTGRENFGALLRQYLDTSVPAVVNLPLPDLRTPLDVPRSKEEVIVEAVAKRSVIQDPLDAVLVSKVEAEYNRASKHSSLMRSHPQRHSGAVNCEVISPTLRLSRERENGAVERAISRGGSLQDAKFRESKADVGSLHDAKFRESKADVEAIDKFRRSKADVEAIDKFRRSKADVVEVIDEAGFHTPVDSNADYTTPDENIPPITEPDPPWEKYTSFFPPNDAIVHKPLLAPTLVHRTAAPPAALKEEVNKNLTITAIDNAKARPFVDDFTETRESLRSSVVQDTGWCDVKLCDAPPAQRDSSVKEETGGISPTTPLDSRLEDDDNSLPETVEQGPSNRVEEGASSNGFMKMMIQDWIRMGAITRKPVTTWNASAGKMRLFAPNRPTETPASKVGGIFDRRGDRQYIRPSILVPQPNLMESQETMSETSTVRSSYVTPGGWACCRLAMCPEPAPLPVYPRMPVGEENTEPLTPVNARMPVAGENPRPTLGGNTKPRIPSLSLGSFEIITGEQDSLRDSSLFKSEQDGSRTKNQEAGDSAQLAKQPYARSSKSPDIYFHRNPFQDLNLRRAQRA